jgi:putative ABC transport system permease protein
VAIVNRTMAERFWPEESPLGKRFRFAEDPERFVEVVGIAEDAKYTTLTEEAAEYIYLPMKQSFTPSSALVARVPGNPAASIHSVTSTVQELDASLPLVDPTTGPQLIHDASWGPRMAALILLGLGMVSLLLAGLGVYSIAYQAVEQRRHEIGVRLALGAERGHVLRLVLEQIGKVVLLGVGVGVLLVLGLRSWFLTLLYGGWEHGWIVCCAVGVGLAVVAIAASLAPAVRGMRVNPTVTLQANV